MESCSSEIAIQVLAMPADTNANGDIFGGWLVSQMDLAAGVLAKKQSGGRAATVAIQNLVFLKPVHVGDLVSCHVTLKKIGHTSMTIAVEVWINDHAPLENRLSATATFVFVALTNDGQPRAVNQ